MKLRLHLVHFGWKDDGAKWCLNDLSKDDHDRIMKSITKIEQVENMYACYDEKNKLKRTPDDFISESNDSEDHSRKESDTSDTRCAIATNVTSKRNTSLFDTSVHEAAGMDKRLKGVASSDDKENSLRENMFESDNKEICYNDGIDEDMTLANRHCKLMEDMDNLQYSLEDFNKKMFFFMKK